MSIETLLSRRPCKIQVPASFPLKAQQAPCASQAHPGSSNWKAWVLDIPYIQTPCWGLSRKSPAQSNCPLIPPPTFCPMSSFVPPSTFRTPLVRSLASWHACRSPPPAQSSSASGTRACFIHHGQLPWVDAAEEAGAETESGGQDRHYR